jgi:large subunit ribosomal protein L29
MALKPAKLRDTETAALEREAGELRDQIWKLNVQSSTGQMTDPHKASAARRDLARVLTILREREIAQAEGRKR